MAVIQGDYLIQVTVNTGSNVYTGCWISCKNEMGIITTAFECFTKYPPAM